MNINTNISGIKTQSYLNNANKSLAKAMEQLSSGKRINSAKDDAAGLAISTRMTSQISGMGVASRNANDGISMIETAEGAMGSISDILGRMRDLAVQAANGTYSYSAGNPTATPAVPAGGDKVNLKTEFDALVAEIDVIASKTNFNGVQLLNTANNLVKLQIGSNSGDTLDVTFQLMSTAAAGLNVTGLDIATSNATASTAITRIDTALDIVSTQRANMGAYINRLEFTIGNLTTNSTNLSAANSRIEDADMAQASSEMTKQSVLVQAGVAMLTQANQAPQNVLKLIS